MSITPSPLGRDVPRHTQQPKRSAIGLLQSPQSASRLLNVFDLNTPPSELESLPNVVYSRLVVAQPIALLSRDLELKLFFGVPVDRRI